MSQTYKQDQEQDQTRQNRHFTPLTKDQGTLRPEQSIEKDDSHRLTIVRSPAKKRTVPGTDSQKKPTQAKHKPANVNIYSMGLQSQKKILLAVSLVQKFLEIYSEKERIGQEERLQRHIDRKKAFLLSGTSDFKTIQPVTVQHMELAKSFAFFTKVKEGLKNILSQNVKVEYTKRKSKLTRMFSYDKCLESNRDAQKQNSHQINKSLDGRQAFITNIFKSSSMLQDSPHVNLMEVSSVPTNTSEMLRKSSIKKLKFNALKQSNSYRLRLNPPTNKYQSRKKQEIRLFLQLDFKTQNLKNFRSEEGKLFKFNQNLKIMIKNANICRIVLISKKKAVMQQFQKLNKQQCRDNSVQNVDQYNRNQANRNYHSKNKYSKVQTTMYHNQDKLKMMKSSENTTQNSYKQKAIRIKNYFQQALNLFGILQSFLQEFIKKDKGYDNYLQQNKLKLKLRIYQKHSQKQQFYHNFVDKCFHLSQITRLYFNALGQMAHQNIDIKEIQMLNKEELEKQNKVLIKLRYVLIYLQKQCENTEQSSFPLRSCNSGSLNSKNKPLKINYIMSELSSPRVPVVEPKIIMSSLMKGVLEKKANQKSVQSFGKPVTLQVKTSQNNQKISFNNLLNQTSTKINAAVKTSPGFYKECQNNSFHQIKNEKQKQKQIDMNQIWKTFYNKKFSSNAMRMRLY